MATLREMLEMDPKAAADAFGDSPAAAKYSRRGSGMRHAMQGYPVKVSGGGVKTTAGMQVVYRSHDPLDAPCVELLPEQPGDPTLTVYTKTAATEIGRPCGTTAGQIVKTGYLTYEAAVDVAAIHHNVIVGLLASLTNVSRHQITVIVGRP